MCGIAGAYFWRDGSAARDVERLVTRMTSAMAHRGPDGSGVANVGGQGIAAALGHRRLAIIDLSDRGAQPMKSVTAPVWVTFNGEVYNFPEVRQSLERAGRHFQSRSDTEVVLQGYEEWGPDVVERLHGMFAFGIYDGRDGRLVLTRDRLGIKPLYVHRSAEGVLFASELRGILASGMVPRRLDRVALDQYLAYQTATPPRTLIEKVEFVEPGQLLVLEREGRERRRRYWDVIADATPAPTTTSVVEARAHVRDLLRASVKGHLVSDVPVAVFLSGGIDSTALVALCHEVGATAQTFSVAMPGTAHDESPFARLVADHYGCAHTEVILSEGELAAQIPGALASLDHPSGDGINTYVVAGAVQQAGLKVALSGLGGDELFGGYPSFERLRRAAAHARWWRRSPTFVRSLASSALRSRAVATVGTKKMAAVLEGDGSWSRTFPVFRQVFGREDRRRLLGPAAVDAGQDAYVSLLQDVATRHPDLDLMSFVSFAEIRTYMHDVLLRDSDQMSMAHGLEVRLPLLDHRLVEFVMGLPERTKEPGGRVKRLLVDSLDPAIPSAAVNRPKQGFVLPFDRWMRGDLRELCEHHLGACGLAGGGVLEASAVRSLWTDFQAGRRSTSWSRPWTLVALGAWLEGNGVTA